MRARPAADTYAFVIQSLCRMALAVAAPPPGPAWAAALGAAFARQELQRVLRGQRLFAKPGRFNWTIFLEEEEGDPYAAQDQVGDVGEDALAERLDPDAEEEPDNPYGGENTDYGADEIESNVEPA